MSFRNKVITHKQGGKVYRGGMTRFHTALGGFELLEIPFDIPAAAKTQIDTLFAKCAACLTAEEANEGNVWERWAILSRNCDRLPDVERGEVDRLLDHYGGISTEPADLAEFVLDLANELVPQLSRLCPDVDPSSS